MIAPPRAWPPVMEKPAFQVLYSAARSGDREARGRLLEGYRGELRGFLASRSGPGVRRHADVEDVVQRAMLTFLERLPTFPEHLTEPDLRARLFQIGKWTATQIAGRDRRELREGSVETPEPAQSQPSQGTVTREDDLRQLRGLIDRMRDTYASVLRPHVLEGKSPAEIAERLELPAETVKKRLARARAELKRIVGEGGPR